MSMSRHIRLLFALSITLTLTVLIFAVSDVPAQNRTVTVIAEGVATAKPTFALIEGKISAGGESAEDAREGFREIKDALVDAFADADSLRLEIEFLGEQLESAMGAEGEVAMMALGGGGDAGPAGKFAFSESVSLRLTIEGDMDRTQVGERITQAVDIAQEAGLSFGESNNMLGMVYGVQDSFAKFGAENEQQLINEATSTAMDHARRQAAQLARLADGSIGAVVSIEAIDPIPQTQDSQMQLMLMMFGQMGGDLTEDMLVPSNRDIEVKRKLRVVFELTD